MDVPLSRHHSFAYASSQELSAVNAQAEEVDGI
jgi:hypothetical protein